MKYIAYTVSLDNVTRSEAQGHLKGFVWGDCETEETTLCLYTQYVESFEGVDMYFNSYTGSYIFIDNPQGA